MRKICVAMNLGELDGSVGAAHASQDHAAELRADTADDAPWTESAYSIHRCVQGWFRGCLSAVMLWTACHY